MSPTPEQALDAAVAAMFAHGWFDSEEGEFRTRADLALTAEQCLAALSPPSAAAVPSEQLEEAITHICNWFTYQNDHWKHTLGDLIRANVGPLLAGFPVADAAAQPKAPSPSEYGPLIPSLGPIKMPEPDQEILPPQPAPSPTPAEAEIEEAFAIIGEAHNAQCSRLFSRLRPLSESEEKDLIAKAKLDTDRAELACATLRSALASRGSGQWTDPPSEQGSYWWFHAEMHKGCSEPRFMVLVGRGEHLTTYGGVHSGEKPADLGGKWMRIAVPAPPAADAPEMGGG